MTNFFLFPTTKKVRGPEAENSENRTGSGRGKGPKSKSDCPDLRGLLDPGMPTSQIEIIGVPCPVIENSMP